MITRKAVTRNRALAARVKRYHTWPTLHQETVGEHTFRVMSIYREIFGTPSNPDLIEYMLDHDITEIGIGDPPFPVKMNNPALKREYAVAEAQQALVMGLPTEYCIETADMMRFKVCDLLQMWEFGKIEKRMGNMLAIPIIDDTIQAALAILNEEGFPDRERVMEWIRGNEL
jgi:hypothetical protein